MLLHQQWCLCSGHEGLETSLIWYHIQAPCTYLPAHNVCSFSCTLKKENAFYSSSLGCFYSSQLTNCLHLFFTPKVRQTYFVNLFWRKVIVWKLLMFIYSEISKGPEIGSQHVCPLTPSPCRHTNTDLPTLWPPAMLSEVFRTSSTKVHQTLNCLKVHRDLGPLAPPPPSAAVWLQDRRE